MTTIAQRPLILAALQATLAAGVPLAAGRVYLPWDTLPELREVGTLLQIDIGETEVDDLVILGRWQHLVHVRIGAIKAGVYDYPVVWQLLNAAAAAIAADPTLGGTCWRIDITGMADFITQAGDRIMWPHLDATIYYLTPVGSL